MPLGFLDYPRKIFYEKLFPWKWSKRNSPIPGRNGTFISNSCYAQVQSPRQPNQKKRSVWDMIICSSWYLILLYIGLIWAWWAGSCDKLRFKSLLVTHPVIGILEPKKISIWCRLRIRTLGYIYFNLELGRIKVMEISISRIPLMDSWVESP